MKLLKKTKQSLAKLINRVWLEKKINGGIKACAAEQENSEQGVSGLVFC